MRYADREIWRQTWTQRQRPGDEGRSRQTEGHREAGIKRAGAHRETETQGVIENLMQREGQERGTGRQDAGTGTEPRRREQEETDRDPKREN